MAGGRAVKGAGRRWTALLSACVLAGLCLAARAPAVRAEEGGLSSGDGSFEAFTLPKKDSPPPRPAAGASPGGGGPVVVAEVAPRIGTRSWITGVTWGELADPVRTYSLALEEERAGRRYRVETRLANGVPGAVLGVNDGHLAGSVGDIDPERLPISLVRRPLRGADVTLSTAQLHLVAGKAPGPAGDWLLNLSAPVPRTSGLTLRPGFSLLGSSKRAKGPTAVLSLGAFTSGTGDSTLQGDLDLVTDGRSRPDANFSLGAVRYNPGVVVEAGLLRLALPREGDDAFRPGGTSWSTGLTRLLGDGRTWWRARTAQTVAPRTLSVYGLSAGRRTAGAAVEAGVASSWSSGEPASRQEYVSVSWPRPQPVTLRAAHTSAGQTGSGGWKVSLEWLAPVKTLPLAVRLGYGGGTVSGWWLEVQPGPVRVRETVDETGAVREVSLNTRTDLNGLLAHPLTVQGYLRDEEAEAGQGTLSLRYAHDSPLRSPLGQVTGRAFVDANLNDVYDPGEAPLSGVGVVLSGAKVARTDEAGRFAFVRVPYGEWTLALDPRSVPAGLEGGPARKVRVAAKDLTVDLPAQLRAMIRGRLYVDENGDGRRDAGEPAVALAPISLGELSLFTDAEGRFTVSLPGGTPVLSVDAAWLSRRGLKLGNSLPLRVADGEELTVDVALEPAPPAVEFTEF